MGYSRSNPAEVKIGIPPKLVGVRLVTDKVHFINTCRFTSATSYWKMVASARGARVSHDQLLSKPELEDLRRSAAIHGLEWSEGVETYFPAVLHEAPHIVTVCAPPIDGLIAFIKRSHTIRARAGEIYPCLIGL
jgi:hypothetical protein